MKDVKPYYQTVENFLRETDDLKVRSMVLVALTDDDEIHDVICDFGAGPFELAEISGLLNLHAAHSYIKINEEEDEPDE